VTKTTNTNEQVQQQVTTTAVRRTSVLTDYCEPQCWVLLHLRRWNQQRMMTRVYATHISINRFTQTLSHDRLCTVNYARARITSHSPKNSSADQNHDYVRMCVVFLKFLTRSKPDLWPHQLETGTPVTPALWNVHTNFGYPTPFVFELEACTGWTDNKTEGLDT